MIIDNISHVIDAKTLEDTRKFLEDHEKFVVLVHMSPDGDAIGSSVAMVRYLQKKGKTATAIYNDRPGDNLNFIPGVRDGLVYEDMIGYPAQHEDAVKAIKECDAVICLDFNALHRLGNIENEIKAKEAPRLIIDHHLDPQVEDFNIIISHPELGAACEVLYHVIMELGDDSLIDQSIAIPLYCGMMTDTGEFVYSSERPDIYLIVARLLQTGFNKEQLHRAFALQLERRVRLKGYCLYHKMVTLPEHKAAYFSLSNIELKRFNHQKGDTEGFVNEPLDIEGIQVSAFFREEKNFVKVSLRSKGDYPVNIIAEKFFNGGGHKNAAGGEFLGSLQRAESLFVKVLPSFDKYL